MRASLMDVRPLRQSAQFRRLWLGTCLSQVGSQLTVFAVMLQVWQLTHSPVWTGSIGLAHALPMLALSPFGGALADRVDRRTLVLLTSTGQLLTVVALAAQAVVGVDSVWLVLVLVAVQTSFSAIGSPARRTFVPRLLPPDQVPAGLALTHVGFQAAMLLGPSLAGLVAAGWGLQVCYAVDAVTFLAAMYGVLRLPSLRPEPAEDHDHHAVRRILTGLRFVTGTPVLRGAFATDLFATVFAMPVALFPMVNDERFHGSPRTLGLFLTAIAVGGVLASAFSGSFTSAARPGRVMLASAALWGLALTAFGLVDSLLPTLLALAVAGAADTVSVVSRGTITQLATPDALRGRVSSLEGIVGVSGPDVGNVRAGLVAGWTSPELALSLGGLMCVAGVGWVAWRNVAVRRFAVAPQPGDRELTKTG
jgi:MFS family permease